MSDESRLAAFFRLERFEEIDSTNEELKRRAARGAGEGALIWAGAQTGGRGRRGRSFVSPPGNLYMSTLLRPDRAPARAAQLGFAAALAVGEAALPLLPPAAALAYKWPNDVLIDGRKTSGILLESQATTSGTLDWLIVGIGVNLVSFPEGLETPATSLRAAGAAPVAPDAMLVRVAGRFLFWYERWLGEGFAPLREAWLARAQGLGQRVRVRLGEGDSEGRFAGLDEEGALLLESGPVRRRITAGDVFPAAR
jgi:BirA family biotin operon repressor/biotin-[acetyl-CoA-carboxylase] ligase